MTSSTHFSARGNRVGVLAGTVLVLALAELLFPLKATQPTTTATSAAMTAPKTAAGGICLTTHRAFNEGLDGAWRSCAGPIPGPHSAISAAPSASPEPTGT